ncbi:MAG TPA: PleD family two-component system response regulator, partial [Amaricoccus sp.]|nr:PleD family two-component system response regulator [Amaricoccus sp.]
MSGRVLVVDDVATNRLLLRAKLSSAYYDVVVAENGTQALEMARREQPDMVMLDVMMPDMDGFEVCAVLKASAETAHIPVIMVTALDTPEERIRGLDAGADDFLSKPFNDLALFARVRNLMRMKMMFDELRLRDMTSRELGIVDLVPEPEVEIETGGPILLAPPSGAAGQGWAAQLGSRLAIPTIVTHSEREALNLARMELPDCFVVHQALAEGGDGLRLVSALRARPETRQSAVILVVENGDVQTAAKGLDLGASDYIEAPFDVSELIARIRSQLRRKRYSDRLRTNLRNGLKLAVIDPLTGIYNRRYASQHMLRVMERARETDGAFAVMMMDLDKFKSINDRFGHDAGDAVLREFSRRLQENIRGVDLVARFGGEEFFVAMPDIDNHAAAHAAERIRRAI